MSDQSLTEGTKDADQAPGFESLQPLETPRRVVAMMQKILQGEGIIPEGERVRIQRYVKEYKETQKMPGGLELKEKRYVLSVVILEDMWEHIVAEFQSHPYLGTIAEGEAVDSQDDFLTSIAELRTSKTVAAAVSSHFRRFLKKAVDDWHKNICDRIHSNTPEKLSFTERSLIAHRAVTGESASSQIADASEDAVFLGAIFTGVEFTEKAFASSEDPRTVFSRIKHLSRGHFASFATIGRRVVKDGAMIDVNQLQQAYGDTAPVVNEEGANIADLGSDGPTIGCPAFIATGGTGQTIAKELFDYMKYYIDLAKENEDVIQRKMDNPPSDATSKRDSLAV